MYQSYRRVFLIFIFVFVTSVLVPRFIPICYSCLCFCAPALERLQAFPHFASLRQRATSILNSILRPPWAQHRELEQRSVQSVYVLCARVFVSICMCGACVRQRAPKLFPIRAVPCSSLNHTRGLPRKLAHKHRAPHPHTLSSASGHVPAKFFSFSFLFIPATAFFAQRAALSSGRAFLYVSLRT